MGAYGRVSGRANGCADWDGADGRVGERVNLARGRVTGGRVGGFARRRARGRTGWMRVGGSSAKWDCLA